MTQKTIFHNIWMKHIASLVAAIALATALPLAAKGRPGSGTIPGYAYGDPKLPKAPYTLEDLEKLKTTLLFTDKDAYWLRESRKVLEPHAEEILDTWYGFVGSIPHLIYYFSNKAGEADANYLARVRQRFIQWVYDTAAANYDQDWLNYQYEIGRRHHRVGKNRADNADAPEHIPFRYNVALLYPITTTLKPFLARGGHSPAEIDAMHQAWIKSVLLQVILWSHPFVNQGDF